MIPKAPVDLCPEHTRIWKGWRDHHYNPHHPQDWPGQPLLDSRTSHQARRADWETKNGEQMRLTEECCRSGRSPQCNREEGATVTIT
jgi:hypothetical protein